MEVKYALLQSELASVIWLKDYIIEAQRATVHRHDWRELPLEGCPGRSWRLKSVNCRLKNLTITLHKYALLLFVDHRSAQTLLEL